MAKVCLEFRNKYKNSKIILKVKKNLSESNLVYIRVDSSLKIGSGHVEALQLSQKS